MVEAGVDCVGSEPKLSIMGRVTTGPVEATLHHHHPGPPAQYCQHSPPQYLVPLVLALVHFRVTFSQILFSFKVEFLGMQGLCLLLDFDLIMAHCRLKSDFFTFWGPYRLKRDGSYQGHIFNIVHNLRCAW